MTSDNSKIEVFNLLKSELSKYSENMSVEKDTDDNYYLNTLKVGKNKKPAFFGAVQIKKNYVSYHLMPVYTNPVLLELISDGLKKKMQGKSCFNFEVVDKQLFSELKILTKASYNSYKKEGYV